MKQLDWVFAGTMFFLLIAAVAVRRYFPRDSSLADCYRGGALMLVVGCVLATVVYLFPSIL